MNPYRLSVDKGNQCWLVSLDVPGQAGFIVLGKANSEEEAIALALEIRAGVMDTSSERR